jgi:hypothetical protein
MRRGTSLPSPPLWFSHFIGRMVERLSAGEATRGTRSLSPDQRRIRTTRVASHVRYRVA